MGRKHNETYFPVRFIVLAASQQPALTQPNTNALEGLRAEQKTIERLLDWGDPATRALDDVQVNIAVAEKVDRGVLTVLDDGIIIDGAARSGRWQFWKVSSIEARGGFFRSTMTVSFDPVNSGAADLVIVGDVEISSLYHRVRAVFDN